MGAVFDGFFIDDHVTFDESIPVIDPLEVDGVGVVQSDAPEVTLTSRIIAGASVGVPGLVEAGVEGGIEASIQFDLNDVPDPIIERARDTRRRTTGV